MTARCALTVTTTGGPRRLAGSTPRRRSRWREGGGPDGTRLARRAGSFDGAMVLSPIVRIRRPAAPGAGPLTLLFLPLPPKRSHCATRPHPASRCRRGSRSPATAGCCGSGRARPGSTRHRSGSSRGTAMAASGQPSGRVVVVGPASGCRPAVPPRRGLLSWGLPDKPPDVRRNTPGISAADGCRRRWGADGAGHPARHGVRAWPAHRLVIVPAPAVQPRDVTRQNGQRPGCYPSTVGPPLGVCTHLSGSKFSPYPGAPRTRAGPRHV